MGKDGEGSVSALESRLLEWVPPIPEELLSILLAVAVEGRHRLPQCVQQSARGHHSLGAHNRQCTW